MPASETVVGVATWLRMCLSHCMPLPSYLFIDTKQQCNHGKGEYIKTGAGNTREYACNRKCQMILLKTKFEYGNIITSNNSNNHKQNRLFEIKVLDFIERLPLFVRIEKEESDCKWEENRDENHLLEIGSDSMIEKLREYHRREARMRIDLSWDRILLQDTEWFPHFLQWKRVSECVSLREFP